MGERFFYVTVIMAREFCLEMLLLPPLLLLYDLDPCLSEEDVEEEEEATEVTDDFEDILDEEIEF